MKTILCHFYNEEYLLPFWLNHHKKYFDHGIMIDYQSTDNSVDLIKEICPTWDIVKSKNLLFDAHKVDVEVTEYERNVTGFKICLNVTEFLIGRYQMLDEITNRTQILISSYIMVDRPEDLFTDIKDDLLKERTFGIGHGPQINSEMTRRSRSLHNYNVIYPIGRHFPLVDKEDVDFKILWYGYSPFNDNLLNRKLQIQNRMPLSDKASGLGKQHITDKEKQLSELNKLQKTSVNLKLDIERYLEYYVE